MISVLLALASSVATSASTDFEFSGLNTTSEITFADPELKACVGTVANGSCALARPSFANIRIQHSIVVVKSNRLDSMFIHATAADFNDAVRALTAKYGKPSSSDVVDVANDRVDAHYWYFNDGVLMCTIRGKGTVFSVIFSSKKKPTPIIDF